MCQYSETNKLKKTEEDIVCYKVCIKMFLDEERFMSPTIGFKYKIRESYSMDKSEILEKIRKIRIFDDVNCYEITKGFHSYENLSDAESHASRTTLIPLTPVILRCIIPKGSYIMRGTEMFVPSIVSNQITIKEIVCYN